MSEIDITKPFTSMQAVIDKLTRENEILREGLNAVFNIYDDFQAHDKIVTEALQKADKIREMKP